jgi:hypothetical protein
VTSPHDPRHLGDVSDEQSSPEPPPKHPGGRPKLHGYREMRDLMHRRIDGRSPVAIAVRRFRQDLIDDLGGDPSRAQRAIIETVSRTWLLLGSLDRWLEAQPSIVNAKKRSLLPIVIQRQTLADSLLRHLTALGLERRPAAVETLASYLAKKAADAIQPAE